MVFLDSQVVAADGPASGFDGILVYTRGLLSRRPFDTTFSLWPVRCTAILLRVPVG
jgi:hypothetical protein